MKYFISSVILASVLVLPAICFATGTTLPDGLLYESQGSCATNDLSFTALQFTNEFSKQLDDYSTIDVYIYLGENGGASIYFDHYIENYDATIGGFAKKEIRQEFTSSAWTPALGNAINIEKLGILSWQPVVGALTISIQISDSYFKELSDSYVKTFDVFWYVETDLNDQGKTVKQVCSKICPYPLVRRLKIRDGGWTLGRTIEKSPPSRHVS